MAKAVTKTKTETKTKIKEATAIEAPDVPQSSRIAVSAFFSKKIEDVENKTHLVSNVSKYCDPLSTGFLVTDWLYSGGIYNVMASVAGPEGSSKSTQLEATIGSGVSGQLIFASHIDAEGTINDDYAQRKFAMFGLDYYKLQRGEDGERRYRYYKENVIEPIFDYMHNLLKTLPQKVWIPKLNSWAYVFDKRDAEEAKLMSIYGVKPDKTLSRNDKFICPTDYSGIEAGFFLDSFAAMVTSDDDEGDKKGRRRAAEAAAFSDQLKRISARLSNRGCLMFGVNQVRESPNASGPSRGPSYYEPGGNALKFFTAQRSQVFSTNSGFPTFMSAKYEKDFGGFAEKSVLDDNAFDLYDYKRIKNTKNKPGNPNKVGYLRVWKADHNGEGHGYDPVFDTFYYLLVTKQLKREGRKLVFRLRKSIGKNRAAVLNDLPPFEDKAFKLLILSEVFSDKETIKKALAAMGLSKPVALRKSLFEQIKSDKKVVALGTSKSKSEDDEDFESTTEY